MKTVPPEVSVRIGRVVTPDQVRLADLEKAIASAITAGLEAAPITQNGPNGAIASIAESVASRSVPLIADAMRGSGGR